MIDVRASTRCTLPAWPVGFLVMFSWTVGAAGGAELAHPLEPPPLALQPMQSQSAAATPADAPPSQPSLAAIKSGQVQPMGPWKAETKPADASPLVTQPARSKSVEGQPAEPAGSPKSAEAKQAPPHVVLVAYEDEYQAARTLRDFARLLQEQYGCRTTLLVGQPEKDLPGLEVLEKADVLLLYVRRKALPAEQLQQIRRYLEAGRPLVALRTSSHAFVLRPGSPPTAKQQWPEFDQQVLGGNYHGHTGNQFPPPEIVVAPEAKEHPILAGIEPKKWRSGGSLYLVSPIDPKATVLLWGQTGPHKEPVAWTRSYRGGRVFYTSLGHPDDFDHSPQFVRLLVQAVFWAMNRPLPPSKAS